MADEPKPFFAPFKERITSAFLQRFDKLERKCTDEEKEVYRLFFWAGIEFGLNEIAQSMKTPKI